MLPAAYVRICIRRHLYQITHEEESNIKQLEERWLQVDTDVHNAKSENSKAKDTAKKKVHPKVWRKVG